jgi:hypothetical protein
MFSPFVSMESFLPSSSFSFVVCNVFSPMLSSLISTFLSIDFPSSLISNGVLFVVEGTFGVISDKVAESALNKS